MRYDEIIAHVRKHGGPTERDAAERNLIAVTEVLGQRLAGNEPSNLASQLPSELKQPLTQRVGEAERFNSEEFVRRVAERSGSADATDEARTNTRVVFTALNAAVTSGEMNDVLSQLPGDYQHLLP